MRNWLISECRDRADLSARLEQNERGYWERQAVVLSWNRLDFHHSEWLAFDAIG